MKTFLIFVFLFLSSFVFSQTIKIEVSEVLDTYVYDSTVFNLLNDSKTIYEIREVNGSYEIDLTHKTFIHIKNGIVESTGNISFDVDGGIFIINFLIDGYNMGMIINPDINNEQVSWFSILGNLVEVCRFTNFQIIKGY